MATSFNGSPALRFQTLPGKWGDSIGIELALDVELAVLRHEEIRLGISTRIRKHLALDLFVSSRDHQRSLVLFQKGMRLANYPKREIGFDNAGRPIEFAPIRGPKGRNFGYMTDAEVVFPDEENNVRVERQFQALWSELERRLIASGSLG